VAPLDSHAEFRSAGSRDPAGLLLEQGVVSCTATAQQLPPPRAIRLDELDLNASRRASRPPSHGQARTCHQAPHDQP